MKRPGFSFVEMLLVIGIIGALAGITIPVFRNYQIRSDLNVATEQIVQGIGRAKLLSQSAKDDSAWGFYAPAGTLFKGDNYAVRDPSFDEVYPMPITIALGGLAEVVFSKIDGIPSATGSILLTDLNEQTSDVLIDIEREAVAIVKSDKLMLCHNGKITITTADNSWPAHKAHGDALGPCPGASSYSSAAPPSSSSSSAASSTPATCTDRFDLLADGTITVTGDLAVQMQLLGSEFTYGENGPDIEITAAYKDRLTGNNWEDLFGGIELNGLNGLNTTVYFSAGDPLLFKIAGYFKEKGWLSYDRELESDDGTNGIMFLKDGDAAPLVQDSNGQWVVSDMLSAVVSGQVIDIGAYSLLLITDFNRPDCDENLCTNNYCSNCTDVTYEDAVILLNFLTPSCS